MQYTIILVMLLALLCPAPPAPRLIVLGDSISVGAGASDPSHRYAALLASQLGLALDNRAIGGTTIGQQPIPTDLHPGDIVIWLTGYNDMRAGHDPTAYGVQLRAAAAAIVAQGAILFLAGCLSMTAAGYAAYGPQWDRGSAALVAAYSAEIASVPGAQHVPLDYDPANVTADLVHPNDAGHAQIARSFLAILQPAPPFTAVWERPGIARVTHAAGCLYHGRTLYRCYDRAGVAIIGGPQTDGAYRPRAGDVFTLVSSTRVIEQAQLRGVIYLPAWR